MKNLIAIALLLCAASTSHAATTASIAIGKFESEIVTEDKWMTLADVVKQKAWFDRDIEKAYAQMIWTPTSAQSGSGSLSFEYNALWDWDPVNGFDVIESEYIHRHSDPGSGSYDISTSTAYLPELDVNYIELVDFDITPIDTPKTNATRLNMDDTYILTDYCSTESVMSARHKVKADTIPRVLLSNATIGNIYAVTLSVSAVKRSYCDGNNSTENVPLTLVIPGDFVRTGKLVGIFDQLRDEANSLWKWFTGNSLGNRQIPPVGYDHRIKLGGYGVHTNGVVTVLVVGGTHLDLPITVARTEKQPMNLLFDIDVTGITNTGWSTINGTIVNNSGNDSPSFSENGIDLGEGILQVANGSSGSFERGISFGNQDTTFFQSSFGTTLTSKDDINILIDSDNNSTGALRLHAGTGTASESFRWMVDESGSMYSGDDVRAADAFYLGLNPVSTNVVIRKSSIGGMEVMKGDLSSRDSIRALNFEAGVLQLNATSGGSVTSQWYERSLYFITTTGATFTLPSTGGIAGQIRIVKVISPATSGTVAAASGQTINGASTYALSGTGKYVWIVPFGTNWEVVGGN